MASNRGTQRPRLQGRPTRWNMKSVKQNYNEIVKKCQAEGILFEDPVFEATDASIFFSKSQSRSYEWKRPKELCDNPQYITGGASRFDVQQGLLNNSWLLAAIASLTCNPSLLNRVIVPDQSFSGPGYVGCFKFNIWHQGEWEEVVVDDRLPTNGNKLTYMHSASRNEFWSALLEKAYAKLGGSYESLKGGSPSEAMVDFTGGVTESFDLRKAEPDLLSIMLKASARGSLMGCSIDADPKEARCKNGLVKGLAYSVTAVKMVEIKTQRTQAKVPLVRVRNPWGNEREWTGAWSDKSREWNLLSEDERRDIGLTFDDDGEFWMSFKDWQVNFHKLEICNLGPDSLSDSGSIRWEATSKSNEWIRRVSAGGCRNFLASFASNPQYRVELNDSDEDGLCTMVIALLQKDGRKKRKLGLNMLTIGYAIYKIEKDMGGSSRLDTSFFKFNSACDKSPSFVNAREVCGRHKLSPGTYVIIPSTFDPNETGKFLLRIFTEKPQESSEMDEGTGIMDSRAPPQTEEDSAVVEKMRRTFEKIAGVDGEIDAYELQNILNSLFGSAFKFDGFSIDICSSMVAMLDGDLTGKLGFEEFTVLWNDLREFKATFAKFDADKCGKLSSYELRQALRGCGYRLSNENFSSIVLRYSNKSGEIPFDAFIHCVIRLKTMIASFSALEENGVASFELEEFIQTTIYS